MGRQDGGGEAEVIIAKHFSQDQCGLNGSSPSPLQVFWSQKGPDGVVAGAGSWASTAS